MKGYKNIIAVSCISISLFATALAIDNKEFIPNDPPRRTQSTVKARPIATTPFSVALNKSSRSEKLSLYCAFQDGRQLVERVIIKPGSPTNDRFENDLILHLSDSGREHHLEGQLLPDGRIEFLANGLYADGMRLECPGTLDPNDLDLTVKAIALGSETRIMLIGDSITYGKFADNLMGYRHMLYDQLAANYNIDFVGDFGDPPYEGHFQGGEKINDFYPRGFSAYATGEMDVTGSMNRYRPNIVAIHLGTNDLNSETGMPLAPYGENGTFYETQTGEMATLLDYLLKWHNGEYGTDLQHILVSLITPIKYRDSVCVEFNLELARLVNDFRNGVITGQPEPIELVDHFSRFREWPGLIENYYKALMYDALHPNTAGHNLMADTYYEAFAWLLSGERNWFTDITGYAGLFGGDIAYNGDFAVFENQGAAIADMDGDGESELYMTRTASDRPEARDFLYKSSGYLPFIENAADLNIDDPGSSRGALFVDIDNDGDLDLFNAQSGAQNRLYRNDDGLFTDITSAAGISNLTRVTTGVTAADFDNDGDLDLYAINSREKNELYLNDGYGYFQQVDRGADDMVEPSIPSLSGAAVDFDNDGDEDIYIVKRGAANVLFINDGAGYFTENAAGHGLALTSQSNGATWADLDNDGDLDVLVGTTSSNGETSLLHVFENINGQFTDRTNQLNITMSGYSPVVADFDNDGDADLLATQEADYAAFYRNEGGWAFTLSTSTGAEIHGGDVRGAVPFDYDGDGDLDIFAARADMFNLLLQNNLSSNNNFMQIQVEGPNGDARGFGSKLWLYGAGHLNDAAYLLGYRQILTANGHITQPSAIQHIGLGTHSACDILVQLKDGSFITKRNAAANQKHIISHSVSTAAGDPAQISLYSGDQQQGTVGEDLAEPLIVKVVDDQLRPVPDIQVDFQVTFGEAQLYLAASSSEKVSIQPEQGTLNGDAKRIYDETASGGAFLMLKPGSSTSGSAHLQSSLSTGGQFYHWIRYINNSSASQEVRIEIDGAPYSVSVPPAAGWSWLRISGNAVNLASGPHEYAIELMSASVQIDKLLLLLNGDYQPDGMEDDSTSPTATDAMGLARRFVKLGEQAGPITVEASLTYSGTLIPDSPIQFHLTSLPGTAVSLTKTSGDHQTGTPGIALSEPFVVTLRDALNNPVPDERVDFTVLSGGGTMTPSTICFTDSLGQAEATLIPGEQSNIQKVQAVAQSLPDAAVTFQANVTGVASELRLVSGTNQSGTVGTVLPTPVKVLILDDTGDPVPNFLVTFSTRDQGARLSEQSNMQNADSVLSVTADTDGYAQVWWQLGHLVGEQTLSIDGGHITGSPTSIQAQAIPGQPVYLLQVSGDNQTAPIQTTLPQPLVVKLLDEFGNGTPNVTVTFRAENNAGVFAGSSIVKLQTDSTGTAGSWFTLGTQAGQDMIIATASALVDNDPVSGSPVTFRANVKPGSPTRAEKVGGDEQSGIVDSDLASPFVVRVTDDYGNPVAGKTITFSVVQGNGTLNRAASLDILTDTQGLASTTYHIGTTAGTHSVRANCIGLIPETHDFTVQAMADHAHSLSYVSGNDQTGAPNAPLSQPLIVHVSDRFGNSVAGHPVRWQVKSEEGRLEGETVKETLTSPDGRALVNLTLGSQMGDSLYQVQAESSFDGLPLQGSPILFIASATVGAPTRVQAITATENLIGAANHELQEPIKVKVTDANGLPVVNFGIDFQILAGGGRFAENDGATLHSLTDANGIAKARWVLGALGVPQQLLCLAIYKNEHLQNSPIIFTAQTVESQPQQLVAVSGNNQTGNAHGELPEPFVVQVLDEFGAPFGGQPVVFSVTKGDAIFVESKDATFLTHTANDGLASARLNLGAAVGTDAYEINVQSFSPSGLELQGSPFVFRASALARTLRIVGGDEQTGTVSTLLPEALKVQLLDENGAGIADEPIRFTKLSGDGHFTSDTLPKTNANGIARVQFKLGQASGPITISAEAIDFGTSVIFHLQALPDTPTQLMAVAGTGQTGIAGHRLNTDIVVRVVDQFDNGVPGSMLSFTPGPGHGVVQPAGAQPSDSLGLAACQWTLGPNPGEQILFVQSESLSSLPLKISATALPNQSPTIDIADSFQVNEGQNLEFEIIVADAENDSITTRLINMPEGAQFDVASRRFSWQPGFDQAGLYSLIIEAADHIGARSMKLTTIHVLDSNRPPIISLDESLPREHTLGRVKMQEAIDFSVAATDPDGDPLFYLWQLNGQPVSSQRHFRLQAQLLPPGPATVEALVFDNSDTARTSWSMEIITAVHLADFRAIFEPYKGAVLSWKSRYEWGNAGFYVQRALQKDGPFVDISPLIESNEHGEYTFIDPKANAGASYFYRLLDVQANGVTHSHPQIRLTPPTPQQFALHHNYPNPFNPGTTLRFDVAERTHVQIIIYDLLGRRIKTLLNQQLPPGYHTVFWDGRNESGIDVASGIYYARLLTPSQQFIEKMLLMR